MLFQSELLMLSSVEIRKLILHLKSQEWSEQIDAEFIQLRDRYLYLTGREDY